MPQRHKSSLIHSTFGERRCASSAPAAAPASCRVPVTMSRTASLLRPTCSPARQGRRHEKENTMAKYLLLKHYRGAPAPLNDAPMDQWAPEEVEAHIRFMNDFAARLERSG